MKYDTGVSVGRGAVGEVFKAWDPELKRWVALKFLRFFDAESVARMFREARAQARIDHPGVCKVYEVGEQDGRPFIAMQFIDGKPLDEVSSSLPLEKRVELLRRVCEAVQAAHAVGLIHRDLKPANILVTTEANGDQIPYVVDFGIAREQSVVGITDTGQALGTPAYMSPEQARGEVSSLDRRSDVFSLGVILYEVFGGTRPFEANSDVESILKVMQEDPPSLQERDVPLDLATVVSKCLEKEKAARYGSARELSDELGRFLDGKPVLARPVGALGRLARRVRREPRFAAIVALFSALVLVLLTALGGGAVKYTQDLRAERAAALEARDDAESVSEFLVKLFESSDPAQSKGENTTARELLERGASRLSTDLVDQPLRRAQLLRVIGTVEHELGLYDEAEDHLREAIEINRARSDGHLETALSLRELGSLLHNRGSYVESEPYYLEAVEILRAIEPPRDLALAKSLNSLGALYHEWGEGRERALPLYEEGLAIFERVQGPDHEDSAEPLENIALFDKERDPEERRALFQRVLRIREERLGEDHPQVGRTLLNLGTFLHYAGESEVGIAHLERSLSIREKTLGAEHAYVAYSANNLGTILYDVGQYERALTLFQKTLQITNSALDPGHPMAIVSRTNVADAARQLGLWDEARNPLEEAEEIVDQDLGEAAGYSHMTSFARGGLATDLGNYREAELSYVKTLQQLGRPPAGSSAAFDAVLAAARAIAFQGRYSEAREQLGTLEQELADAEGGLDPENDQRQTAIDVVVASFDIAECRGEAALARLASVSTAADLPSSQPSSLVDLAVVELLAGHAHLLLGRPKASNESFRRAQDLMAPIAANSAGLRFQALSHEALAALGETESAASLAEQLESSGLANWRWPSGQGPPCAATETD